jgi:acetyl-CoA carboxylase carboxyltransferase component
MDAEARSAFVQPILDRYEEESDAAYSTARLWDDGIIDPRDTRRALALGLAAAARAPIPEPRFGVFRM